jgi:hypothetical protein
MSRLVAALLALLAGGCATYGPTWSEISGERYYNVTTLHRRAAIIERVDGYSAYAQYPIKVEPGPHEIVMQGATSRWAGGTALHTMTLDLEPCKRYYLNAQFDNPATTPTWRPVVDYVESIAGCGVALATK